MVTRRSSCAQAAPDYGPGSCATSANGAAPSETVLIEVQPPPSLQNVSLTNRRCRVSPRSTAIAAAKAPVGTTFRYTLTRSATLTITITHRAAGLRRGKRCLAPTRKLRRAHAKHCTRTVTDGKLTRANQPQGPGAVEFSGRIGRRPLAPGRYRAEFSARNIAGRSTPVLLNFVVVR